MLAIAYAIATVGLWKAANSMRILSASSGDVHSPDGWDPESMDGVSSEIGRCYNPEGDWNSNSWAEKFNEAVEASQKLGDAMPNAQVLSRPIASLVKKLGSLATKLPWHEAAVLTNSRMVDVDEDQLYADSHCFNFNYDLEGIEDPHGCAFFRKSFQPLQSLRKCVLEKFDKSPAWKTYQKIAKSVVSARQQGARDVENPLAMDEQEQGLFDGLAKFTFDGIRRVDEMIKYAGLVDWEVLDVGVIAELEQSISQTIVTKDKKTLLEKELVSSIRTDCFQVEKDTWAELSDRAKLLKRALPCYPLMWDQIEVTGSPELPYSNAITMFDPSLRYPSQVTYDIKSPPICARAALALIAERTKKAPKGYNALSCWKSGDKSWQKCIRPNTYNCVCLTNCFRSALQKMCEFHEGCCSKSTTYNAPLS